MRVYFADSCKRRRSTLSDRCCLQRLNPFASERQRSRERQRSTNGRMLIFVGHSKLGLYIWKTFQISDKIRDWVFKMKVNVQTLWPEDVKTKVL